MKANRCCNMASRDASHETTKDRIRVSNPQRPTLVRRLLENAGWMVPGAILALLPKCPVCVATCAVIGTGVGFSLSATTYLRTLLVILCLASLLYLAARGMRRFAATIFTTQAININERAKTSAALLKVYYRLDLVPKGCDELELPWTKA